MGNDGCRRAEARASPRPGQPHRHQDRHEHHHAARRSREGPSRERLVARDGSAGTAPSTWSTCIAWRTRSPSSRARASSPRRDFRRHRHGRARAGHREARDRAPDAPGLRGDRPDRPHGRVPPRLRGLRPHAGPAPRHPRRLGQPLGLPQPPRLGRDPPREGGRARVQRERRRVDGRDRQRLRRQRPALGLHRQQGGRRSPHHPLGHRRPLRRRPARRLGRQADSLRGRARRPRSSPRPGGAGTEFSTGAWPPSSRRSP